MRTAIPADTGTDQIVTPHFAAGDTAIVELHGDIDLVVIEPLRNSVGARVEQGRMSLSIWPT